MSTVLVIKAHPLSGEASRTVKVLDTFLNTYQATHPEDTVTVLDLYEEFVPEIDKDMLLGWNALRENKAISAEQERKINRFSELTEQFLAADKIIVANALWNLNIPTRLKAWIDTINVAGKTFKYTETGPVGLVENKKMLHIQSSGGVYAGKDPSAQFIQDIFAFVGVTDSEAIYIEGIDHQPDKAEEIMAGVFNTTKQLAEQF